MTRGLWAGGPPSDAVQSPSPGTAAACCMRTSSGMCMQRLCLQSKQVGPDSLQQVARRLFTANCCLVGASACLWGMQSSVCPMQLDAMNRRCSVLETP